MPTIHVCPLRQVAEQAALLKPSGLVTLLSPDDDMPQRPAHLAPSQHLARLFDDISSDVRGMTSPHEDDVRAVIAFGQAWDRAAPLLIHCFAGISRSTAAAFIIAADLHPRVSESAIAAQLRAASPTAAPNPLMILMADQILGRGGRMTMAIADIGYGHPGARSLPFKLELR